MTYEQRYGRGIPLTDLTVVSESSRGTGTTIYFRPDPEIFESTEFDAEWIRENLDIKTYLNRSLRIVFNDKVNGKRFEFQHDGGIEEYLTHLVGQNKLRPVHDEVFSFAQDTIRDGARIEVTLQWTESPKELVRSFVNGIPTRDGGTHEQGLRDAVRSAVRAYMETHDFMPAKLDISADDIREGLVGVVNLFMVEPQFQGQTKDKLNNTDARSLVVSAMRLELEKFLNAHPSAGDAIATRVIQSARARHASRAAAQATRRKTAVSHRLNLPGKLADCSSTDPSECELFIVEGDSAGGSAKQGRDRTFQAILPLRGKVLNAEQAPLKKVHDNKELANIVQALGCGIGAELNVARLRYHKVILLMDADSDGHHITTLLLTFLYRYMNPLIREGYVYLAQPPLYRIQAGKETFWALDEADRDKITREVKKKRRNTTIELQRFKGLGEMMPATLKETTLDPEKRRLLQVTIPEGESTITESTIAELMGRDPAPRFEFIMHHAGEADELDI
jgi:DNA gyrase/topoisomerase IV subunit B